MAPHDAPYPPRILCLEAAGLAALASAFALWASLMHLLELHGQHSPGWMTAVARGIYGAAPGGAAVWLITLLALRRARPRIMGVAVAACLIMLTCVTHGIGLLQAHTELSTTGRALCAAVAAWLAREVLLRHRLIGADIPSPRTLPRRPWEATKHAGYAILGGATAVGLLLRFGPGPVPVGDQPDTLGLTSPAQAIAAFLWTSVAEELLLTAALVALLLAAGRPLWQAMAVAGLLRGAAHLYLGIGPALAMLCLGVLMAYLYSRWRLLTPAVVAHFAVDLLAWMPLVLRLPALAGCMLLDRRIRRHPPHAAGRASDGLARAGRGDAA